VAGAARRHHEAAGGHLGGLADLPEDAGAEEVEEFSEEGKINEEELTSTSTFRRYLC